MTMVWLERRFTHPGPLLRYSMLDEDMRPVEEDSHVITQLWRLSSEKVNSMTLYVLD